ncbi:MAG: preprotein translocase subunit SecE [Acidobacteria bacterium]|nr:preprotein translocase subunit SecE [Acidobacteriota bacterium]HCV00231.1 preprotein translocase subunit SecE [Dehalococcoidia bacterium]|tara:strand:- start:2813 stop:3169 length:357 start_codon:yes stop_codon:yes gene_type:complete
MARAQRRRGSRGRRASREHRNTGGSEEVTEEGGNAVAAAATSRMQPRRSRSWNPFGFLKRLQPRAVADVISELRKVTWPTFAETRYLTIVVAVVAIVVGLILGLFDLLFGWIVEQLFF